MRALSGDVVTWEEWGRALLMNHICASWLTDSSAAKYAERCVVTCAAVRNNWQSGSADLRWNPWWSVCFYWICLSRQTRLAFQSFFKTDPRTGSLSQTANKSNTASYGYNSWNWYLCVRDVWFYGDCWAIWKVCVVLMVDKIGNNPLLISMQFRYYSSTGKKYKIKQNQSNLTQNTITKKLQQHTNIKAVTTFSAQMLVNLRYIIYVINVLWDQFSTKYVLLVIFLGCLKCTCHSVTCAVVPHHVITAVRYKPHVNDSKWQEAHLKLVLFSLKWA